MKIELSNNKTVGSIGAALLAGYLACQFWGAHQTETNCAEYKEDTTMGAGSRSYAMEKNGNSSVGLSGNCALEAPAERALT